MSDGQSQAAEMIQTSGAPSGIPTPEDLAIEAGILAAQMCGDMRGKKAIAYRIIDIAKWYAATKRDRPPEPATNGARG